MKVGRIVLALAASVAAAPTQATTILDASFESSGQYGYTGAPVVWQRTLAQTFTVQNDGYLTSASIKLIIIGAPKGDLTLQIRALSGGKPSEAISGPDALGSSNPIFEKIDTITSYANFGFDRIAVTAGEELAMVLLSTASFEPTNFYAWIVTFGADDPARPSGQYAGGSAFEESPFYPIQTFTNLVDCTFGCSRAGATDLNFRTYVDASAPAIPEPSTWAMMAGGIGAIGGAMRHRRHRKLARMA